jgi:hypothetical protein
MKKSSDRSIRASLTPEAVERIRKETERTMARIEALKSDSRVYYTVVQEDGTFLMTAPMHTLRTIFNLHDSAVDRVLDVCRMNPACACELHRNFGQWPFATKMVRISFSHAE